MGKEKKKSNEKGEERRKKKVSQLQTPSSPVQKQLPLQFFVSFQKFPMHIKYYKNVLYKVFCT